MESILKQGLESLGLDAAAIPTLTEFARRLLEKNKVMNLTAITEPRDVATLHLLDCAYLLTAADFWAKPWWTWAPAQAFRGCLWPYWSQPHG